MVWPSSVPSRHSDCAWHTVVIQNETTILDVCDVTVVPLPREKNSLQVIVNEREQNLWLFEHLAFSFCFQDYWKKVFFGGGGTAYFI